MDRNKTAWDSFSSFVTNILSLIATQPEANWTNQEIFDEFPEKVEDRFLPWAPKSTQFLATKKLASPLIMHHLANRQCTVPFLESKYTKVCQSIPLDDEFDSDKMKKRILLDFVLVDLLDIDAIPSLDWEEVRRLSSRPVQPLMIRDNVNRIEIDVNLNQNKSAQAKIQ